jgi:starch synthase
VLYDRRDHNSFDKSVPEFLRDVNAQIIDETPEILQGLRFVPDVIHGQATHMIAAAQYFSRRWTCPLVGGVHISLKHMSQLMGTEFDPEIEVRERALLELPDQVVAVSDGLKAVICNGYGLAPERVRVVHNGIDTDATFLAKSQRDALRTRYSDRLGLIVFLGTLSPAKGLPAVLAVASRMCRTDPTVHFILAGSMSHASRRILNEALASDEYVRSNVHSIGRIRHSNAMKLAGLADAVVIPSVFEACSYVALEAMLQGTPVIASNVGGIPEIIEDGVSGYLIPVVPGVPPVVNPDLFFDRQQKVLTDRAAAAAIGSRGRERIIRYFNRELMSKRFVRCYESVLC